MYQVVHSLKAFSKECPPTVPLYATQDTNDVTLSHHIRYLYCMYKIYRYTLKMNISTGLVPNAVVLVATAR